MTFRTLENGNSADFVPATIVGQFASDADLSSPWNWKNDGDSERLAQAKLLHELMVREGLGILRTLNECDLKLRARLFENGADLREEESLLEDFRVWLDAAKHVLQGVENLAKEKIEVQSADSLREAVAMVELAFVDDADFFVSDQLAGLRDAAVDSHRSGQCEPFNE
jgi:hypothetical protein